MTFMITSNMATTFTQRLIGAATLDGRIYEEVEADPAATAQAALVVLLASAAAGIGSASAGPLTPVAMVIGTIGAFVGWVSWAALTYLIGTHLLPEPQTRADLGELLRTLAFAAAPGLLHVVGAVPLLRWPVAVVVHVWMLVAMVVAVRHALDYTSTTRAVAVCAVGWAISILFATVMGVFFATPVL